MRMEITLPFPEGSVTGRAKLVSTVFRRIGAVKSLKVVRKSMPSVGAIVRNHGDDRLYSA